MSKILINLLLGLGLILPAQFAVADFKENSIYNLDSVWFNQDGKEVQLKDFSGRPVLLAMVYLTCSFMCPTIISQVRDIESKLDEKAKKNVHIVLVSFDPWRDTPEKLKAYMKEHKLDSKRWTLLTKKDESKIRDLAAVLNFKYKKLEDGEFTHSYMIHVFDKDGVVVTQIDKANQDIKPLAKAINDIK